MDDDHGPDRRDGTAVRLSVVIPHYGDPALITGLIADLAAQNGAPVFEVVVVDDASPVRFSTTAIPSCAAGLDVRVIRRERNGGFGAAVTTGARAARGAILVVLNSDLSLPPDHLAQRERAHVRHGRAVISPAVLHPDGTESWTCRLFPTIRRQTVQHLRVVSGLQYRRRYLAAAGMDPVQWSEPRRASATDWLAGVALSMPLDDFLAIGGMDEAFHMYFEETDLQRRLADCGIPRLHDPAFCVTHAGGGSTEGSRAGAWEWTSRFVYARRHGHPHLLAAALIGVAAVNVVLDAVRMLRGRDVAPLGDARAMLRGIRDGLASSRAAVRTDAVESVRPERDPEAVDG